MLNESVIKLLKSGMWDLATCANGEPNVVPVAFKDVTEDGIIYLIGSCLPTFDKRHCFCAANRL